jgi:hypothetical protein
MLGGTDRPDNLVLLCAECHWEAPDVSNAQYMLDWMRDRESKAVRMDAMMKRMVKGAGLEGAYEELARDHHDLLFRTFMELLEGEQWVGFHGSHISLATVCATTIEAIRRTQAILEAGGSVQVTGKTRQPGGAAASDGRTQ